MESRLPSTNYQTASTSLRFLNYLLDEMLYLFVMLLFINPLVRLLFGNSLYANYWISYLFAFFMLFIYYFAFEALFQRTPGKFITGTRVIMEDGSKPDLGTIVKRTLIRFVPFEVFSIYTGQATHIRGTLWHDRWTSTRVARMTNQIETQVNYNPLPVVPDVEPAVRNNGKRLLLKTSVVFLGFITFVSGGSFILLLLNLIRFGMRWTGNFWEDVFPFILLIFITGMGLFGVIKLAQALRKKG